MPLKSLRKLLAGKGARYTVLVHARNLILTDESGAERVGGAYQWRHIVARDAESAGTGAIDSLFVDPLFLAEVRNAQDARRHAIAEEVVPQHLGDRKRSTAVVFYIDTGQRL